MQQIRRLHRKDPNLAFLPPSNKCAAFRCDIAQLRRRSALNPQIKFWDNQQRLNQTIIAELTRI